MFIHLIVTEPDKSRPVFVHALRRCPRIRLPECVIVPFMFSSSHSSSSGAALEMEKGHISLMPYTIVENLVARGEVELI